MSNPIFQGILFMIPPTSNADSGGPQRKRLKRHMEERLQPLSVVTPFPKDVRLYGKIYYFNHEARNSRDIHNIIKPLFDNLEKKLYEDDKQIIHFEGYRLDMQFNSGYFEVELDLSVSDELIRVMNETACIIEIGPISATPSEIVRITWLQVQTEGDQT